MSRSVVPGGGYIYGRGTPGIFLAVPPPPPPSICPPSILVHTAGSVTPSSGYIHGGGDPWMAMLAAVRGRSYQWPPCQKFQLYNPRMARFLYLEYPPFLLPLLIQRAPPPNCRQHCHPGVPPSMAVATPWGDTSRCVDQDVWAYRL